jgi:hypothetical protein
MNYPMSIDQTAEMFVRSGMFPDLKSVESAATLLIIGRGFGISDYDSVTGLYLRQGKVNMHANVMAAAIKASGKYDYEVLLNSDKECEIQFFRVDSSGRHPLGKHRFTMAQAQRANLTKNFTWKQYPEAMLFARCISAGYRAHCPDALGAAPVYVEQHGEMEVDAPSNSAPPPPQREVPKQEQSDQTSTVVDDEPIPVRQALIEEIENWAEMPREDAIKALVNILDAAGLPKPCDDISLGIILLWARECRSRSVDFADCFTEEFDGLMHKLNPTDENGDNLEF